MGLFGKKKKPAENLMNDKELKEHLADSALAVLINSGELVPEEMAGISVEFGYLMMCEGHGLEGLFKIIKDDNVYYFAAQVDKLMLVNINEEQFLSTTQTMTETHLK